MQSSMSNIPRCLPDYNKYRRHETIVTAMSAFNELTSSKRESMNSLHTLLWHMVSPIPPPPSNASDLWCW